MRHFDLLKLLFLPKFKFGISLSLGGSKSSGGSSFSETTESDIEKSSEQLSRTTGTVTTDSTGVTTDESSQTTTAEQALSLLDEETQALLSGLLTDLAAGSGASGELLAELNERALNAEDTLAGLVDPIVANARSNLEEELGQTRQILARGAGSSMNSLVQQLGLKEAANVEREIASLAATLGFQVQETATAQQEGALAAGTGAVAQITDLLKGATQTGRTTESTEAVRQLEEILRGTERTDLTEATTVEELISALEKASGSGSSSSSSVGFGISL